ncbi:MAG: nodulation protein NfeD [Cyclobacteriaceae bacterium]|nr:nodulation protein NfeD [Cyclobacteriaceae bacterium]MDW8331461.1 nodulation protein NfeD [Cyclobacteriaceae bacterium]
MKTAFRDACVFRIKAGLLLLLLTGLSMQVFAQKTRVMLMEIKTEIDPRTNRYVELALKHAESIKADVVLVEMDTYGGILTDAKEIVDKIMDFKKPIWVYINSDAASAGALIAIACDSIYMSPGASIGAATVVNATGEKAPDKYQSYMRSIMRSTAEENGRNPRIAEGMVDERIAIDSIKKEGEVITFSTTEAIKYGFCEAKVNSLEEILQRNGIQNYELIKFELSGTEKIIAFFLNPFISGLLILIIIGGLWFELQTPGVGFPLAAAVTALILYLVPYYLNGLAENWEVLALFAGISLIIIELFVIPGFGIAGISGIVLTVGSLVLIMLNNDVFDFEFVPANELMYAVAATLGGILGGILLLFIGGVKLADTRVFKRIALTTTQETTQGFVVKPAPEPLKGKRGVAYTVLRPAGKVMIDEKIYDAYTRGEYIEKGDAIEVLDDETTSLRVKKVTD